MAEPAAQVGEVIRGLSERKKSLLEARLLNQPVSLDGLPKREDSKGRSPPTLKPGAAAAGGGGGPSPSPRAADQRSRSAGAENGGAGLGLGEEKGPFFRSGSGNPNPRPNPTQGFQEGEAHTPGRSRGSPPANAGTGGSTTSNNSICIVQSKNSITVPQSNIFKRAHSKKHSPSRPTAH